MELGRARLPLACLALLTVAACSGSTRTDTLRVTAFTTELDSSGDQATLRLRFHRPAVGPEQVGRPLGDPPLILRPEVPVTAHWADRQTLVMVPTAPLRPSTAYTVWLTGRLAELSEQRLFRFVHRPLKVTGLTGADLQALPPQPRLVLALDQAVQARQIEQRCTFFDDDHVRFVRVTALDPAAVTRFVAFQPRERFAQGQRYTLHCLGLVPAEGTAPMTEPWAQKVSTYPLFYVAGSDPRDRPPADAVRVRIRFSTPVKLESLRQHLRITPAAPGLVKGALLHDGRTFVAELSLSSRTQYTVEVASGLTDQYGQALQRAERWQFTTDRPLGQLQMEKGIFVVETAAAGYPVWTRNLSRMEIECAAVPRDRLVRVLTSTMNYDPWYSEDDAKKPVDWKHLGLGQKLQTLPVTAAEHQWQLHQLRLGTLCGGANAEGVYLAELRSPDLKPHPHAPWRFRPRQRVLANVTDLGMLLKVGPASGLVWVTRISTGKPAAGVALTVYSTRGEVVLRGKTDASGLLRLPGARQMLEHTATRAEDWADRAQRLIVVAEQGRDLAVVDANWSNGIQIWNFGVPVDHSDALVRVRGFIQSDRGIYRPGELVHLKGLVRRVKLGELPRVPEDRDVAVEVRDPRGRVTSTLKLPLSPFGGFAFDLPLTADAALGDHQVTATVAGQTFQERFSVQAFRKVTFEVNLTRKPESPRLGDPLRFAGQARYLFGAPVAAGKVKWQVHRRPHRVRVAQYPTYTFADVTAERRWWAWWEEQTSETTFVTEGQGLTDAAGGFAFEAKDTAERPKEATDYLVHVTVTDETDQSVGRSVAVTAHQTDVYLGLHTQEYVQAVGMAFAIQAVAVKPDGTPAAAAATVSLIQTKYECTWRGRHRAYQSCDRKEQVVWTKDVAIPAGSPATVPILPRAPGEYLVRLTAKDGRGGTVAAADGVWVLGPGEAFWSGDESARFTLVASKTSYRPGEVARLVPRDNLGPTTALVTLERDGILDATVTPLPSASVGVKVPLAVRHAPNVFASVTLVRGRTGASDAQRPRFKMGLANLQVTAKEQELRVAVTPERPGYEPGQPVSATVRVTDAAGQPVRAEVSVSVADEGVLQLIGYRTPNPMKAFYAPWGLGVDSATNWNRISRMSSPEVRDLEAGGDSGGAGAPKVRSSFVSSAFFAPALLTDARGEARVTFKAPDNLTAFRIMAVAADPGSRFGAGDVRFTVKKPLMASPVLPRFLAAGDQAEVGVIVHNYTGRAGRATITASTDGFRLEADSQTVTLPAAGGTRVRFNGTVAEARQARFTFAVTMGEHRDALTLTVPVVRPLAYATQTLASGRAAPGAAVPVAWASTVLPADSRLEVRVDQTGLADLADSLRYLIEYPYGCLEQTLSRFIPLTKVQDLAASLGLADLQGTKLREYIRAGVDRVIRHQHDDGHFSLWPAGQAYPHLTTYALYGLAEARKAGVQVDATVLSRGRAALRRYANDPQRAAAVPGGEAATLALAAALLAEHGEPDRGLNARLFEARAALPYYGKASLLLALVRAKAPAAQVSTVLAELRAGITLEGGRATVREWSEASHPGVPWAHFMSSDARTSAIVLSALLEAAPQDPAIPALVEGLKAAQRGRGRFANTQENLYALVALADWARGQSTAATPVTVRLGGKTLAQRTLRKGEVLAARASLSDLAPGSLSLVAARPVHWTVRLVTAQRADQSRPLHAGMTVVRSYLDPRTGTPLAKIRAGDLIKVRLQVVLPTRRHYLALVDRLPAGFEPVNTALATQSAPPVGGRRPPSWSPPTWTYQELHDDRVQAFADDLRDGSHTLEYLARATLPGTFTAAPAQAELMYEPDVLGRTAATRVTVLP
jgi:uncharacterized protein YfaS (alpha-2-macroglobulin family)